MNKERNLTLLFCFYEVDECVDCPISDNRVNKHGNREKSGKKA